MTSYHFHLFQAQGDVVQQLVGYGLSQEVMSQCGVPDHFLLGIREDGGLGKAIDEMKKWYLPGVATHTQVLDYLIAGILYRSSRLLIDTWKKVGVTREPVESGGLKQKLESYGAIAARIRDGDAFTCLMYGSSLLEDFKVEFGLSRIVQ